MVRSRAGMAVFSGLILACTAPSQTDMDSKFRISGQFEWFGFAIQRAGAWVARDRLERFQLRGETGPWTLVGTWLSQPYFSDQSVNETYLAHRSGDKTFRFGRIMPLLGQGNWDDQWYSGFVMLPFIETGRYDGGAYMPALTMMGADATFTGLGGTISTSFLSSDNQKNRVTPSKFDRVAVRYERSIGNLIVGASGYGDTSSIARDTSMFLFDVRYTYPHWVFRGETLNFRSKAGVANGFFVDAYYRPKNWEDATFVARYQNLASSFMTARQGWTVGAKFHLPYDFGIDLNYAFGPDLQSRANGGGWEIGLRRTFSF